MTLYHAEVELFGNPEAVAEVTFEADCQLEAIALAKNYAIKCEHASNLRVYRYIPADLTKEFKDILPNKASLLYDGEP